MGALPEYILHLIGYQGCRSLQGYSCGRNADPLILQGAGLRINSFITRLYPKPTWGPPYPGP